MTPTAPSTRQTLSYLRNLFVERGIKPKNKLGQNFLIDLNLLDLILRSAELTREDLALEVGSGTGSLTVRLLEQSGAVVSIEIDPAFAALTDEEVKERDRVLLLHSDILKNKNELSPDVLRAVADLGQRCATQRVKLVSNLPYAVAVPVISNLLLCDLEVERMVVTVQWEIAERLLASPGTKEYGALAVLVQSLADVELVRRLSPKVFWPRPLVDSAIVCIRPRAAKRRHVGDPSGFRAFLRDLYVHRRKNLRGALASLPNRDLSKSEVDARLAELGLDGSVRAETLDREQHLRLCERFGYTCKH
ncbi:MAG TPA: 16S rRNA (adenine(1518)-N(6)/adenine(1519)-N(6))-dimethyltransferase RsmA [Gemmataceae bacterium]|nr:16S rRNA (adenine(1518)-N(6)/adenine(1519)-N(6))-dimethyltransferase RsmA [Gemmataceae bacterium]